MPNAGIQLKIDVNSAEVRNALRQLANRLVNRKPAFDAIGQSLVTSTHRRFETERGPDGSPWAALSPTYVARPKKQGGRGGQDHPILVRTARLLPSITFKADNDAVAVGTNAKFPGGEYSRAAIHQLGGKAGRGGAATIPARPFLGIDAGDEREIGRLLMKHLEGE
jgi:phage virion morphogenesis protein